MFSTGAGGGVDRTITLKVQALLLPDASCAIAVTRFVPTENAEPVPGVTVRLVSAQLSVARRSRSRHVTGITV
jgi:hypothetical protein